jgi:adenylate cyclase
MASPLESLLDWLLDGAPGAAPPELITRVGTALRAHGVPVDRLTAFVTTLHPTVVGRAFRWTPDAPVEITEIRYGLFETGAFRNSAVAAVRMTKKEMRIHCESAGERSPIVEELQAEGFTDYVALPLFFTDGQTHAVTVATKAPGGFTDAALEAIRSPMRPLARVVEILALRRTASNLLSTYVGRNSGARILAGQIHKGDFETIHAVIWFSDLRGFTEMSSRLPPREVIDTVNRVFECQVTPIEKRGGEVLEFTGDGILAIFPLGVGNDDTTTLCDLALDAAYEAVAAVAGLEPTGASPRIGIALHVGELAYGNVGGANRLDFTAIGLAVNLAARLEGVTAKLGRAIVVSEDFARLTTRPTEDLGCFALKGLPGEVRVLAPALVHPTRGVMATGSNPPH